MKRDFKWLWMAYLISLMSMQTIFADSLPPRFSLNAYTGIYTVGLADLMLSIDGDEIHNLYLDPQAAYGSDQQWFGDLGLGYRWISNDAAVLGCYVFADTTRVSNNSQFWVANPGVEILGRRWDAHINAYVPLAGRSDEVNNFAKLNSVSEPFFTGHSEVMVSEFDLANEIQRVGNGADAMLAYQLFRSLPLKAYIGAYYFDISGTEKLRGGIAGFQYWFDQNIKFFTKYSYDNYQRSTVVAGLGVSFGGVRKHKADPSLSERLTDPVEHYLSNWGHHGSSIPSRTLFFAEGRGSSAELVSDNIAFFTQIGSPNNGGMNLTLADCTFESPCAPSDFSQTGINTLNVLLPSTTLFFNGGNYPALDTAGTGAITLNPGQSVSSRSTDFSVAAIGTDRSTFNGAFILNSNNTLNDIILLPTPDTVAGNAISATNAINVSVNDSQIGSAADPFAETALFLAGSQLDLNNSSIFAARRVIRAQAGSSLTIQSSQMDVTRTVSGGITGISVTGSSTAEINNSQLNASGQGDVVGVNVLSNSNVNIDNSNISVTSLGANADPMTALMTVTGGSIQMEFGTLSLTSPSPSAVLTSGTQITLFDVTCLFNGSSMTC